MASLNVLSTVVVAAITFFTVPIFTRLLDTDGYGIISIYEAWVQIFAIFIGLKADGSIGSAKANLDESEQDAYQYSVLLMSLIPFALVSIVTLLLSWKASSLLAMEPALVVLMLIQSFGTFVVQFFSLRYVFRKEAGKNVLISVGVSVATTVFSIVLVMFVVTGGARYYGRAIGLAVPNILLAAGLIVGLARSQHGRFNIKYWRFCLILTVPLVFNALSQQVLSHTGKISIQLSYGDSMTGVFSVGVLVSSLITYIYIALNNAFVPFMYDDLAGRTSAKVKQRHFNNYLVLFTTGTCAFVMLAPEVLKAMSTEAYWGALEFLPVLIAGKYCVFLYSFPVNYEFFRMKTRSIATGTILAALLNVALCVWLVPRFGMSGAAYASLGAYLSLFLFHFLISRYVLGDRNYPGWKLWAGLVVIAIVSVAYYPLLEHVVARSVIGCILLALALGRVLRARTIF